MRILQKDLEHLVDRINSITKSPMTAYTKSKTGKYQANIGNYHLDFAYGGVALHRIHTTGGGVEGIFGGYYPKKELYNRLNAFLSGIHTVKNKRS